MTDTVISVLIVSYVVLWVVVIGLTVAVVAQMHYMGVLFSALDPVLKFKTPDARVQPGQRLPATRLVDEWGGLRNVAVEPGARVLLFVNLSCGSCGDLLGRVVPLVERAQVWSRELIVIVLGDREHARQLRARHGIPEAVTVLADPGADAIQRWGVARTPTAVPIDSKSRVLSFVESPTLPLLLDLLGIAAPSEPGPPRMAVGTVFTSKEVHAHE
jgi:hypothetical protein